MKKKLFLLVIMILSACGVFSQVTLKLGSVENAEPGTVIQIPVIVTGLSESGYEFIGTQISFSFQGNVLTYESISEGHPNLPLAEWIGGSISGQAAANWFEPGFEPTHVEDNSTLIVFNFLYSGGQTDLSFTEGATEIYENVNGDLIPISSFTGGTVTQAEGSEGSVWNGTGPWSTVANWSNGIPGDSTNAVINTGTTEIASGAVCRNLSINASTQVLIQPGKSLSVNGNMSNDGSIIINSDSLIQGSLIVMGIITQNGTSSMAMNVYNNINYTVSSPVIDETAEIFTGMGSAFFFSEGSNTLGSLASSSILEKGKSYAFESSGDATMVFDGLYNNTLVSIDLTYTSQGNEMEQGWNLVGNPFPSSINTDDFMTMENTDRAIYIWDNNRFLVWNGTAGNIPNGTIPPMQGFFVKANATGAKINFPGEIRMHDFSHFGSGYNYPENVLQIDLLDFDNNKFLDDAFVQIEASSTKGYDGDFDAVKPDLLWDYPQVFFKDNQDNHLAIAAIPDAVDINMGIKVLSDGAYTIKKGPTTFMADKKLYLIDHQEEVVRDLKVEDYTFLANAGEHADRFTLVFTEIGIDDRSAEAGLAVFARNEHILIHSAKDNGRCVIASFDLSGRMIYRKEAVLSEGSSVSLQGVNGINIVRIENGKNNFTFKVFVR